MSSDAPKRRATDLLMPKADLSDPALHTAKELRRWLRILVGLTVVLYILLLSTAIYTYLQGQRNTRALCTIRQNAADRVEQVQTFLQDHPDGVGSITPDDLRRSITTYENTVKALEDVNCSNPELP